MATLGMELVCGETSGADPEGSQVDRHIELVGSTGTSRARQSRTSKVSVLSYLLISAGRLSASRGRQAQRIRSVRAVRFSVRKIRLAQSAQPQYREREREGGEDQTGQGMNAWTSK